MSQLDLASMRAYLAKSYSSINRNKVNGLLAEIEFRNYLHSLGFGDRISLGGWILRSEGQGSFGHHTVAVFPETIQPYGAYELARPFPVPTVGLHTICSRFHEIGIRSYFCSPAIGSANDTTSVLWRSMQLGIPNPSPPNAFPGSMEGFRPRTRRHNFLQYHSDVTMVPAAYVPEEFTKEHLRIAFQNEFMSEISDIDGILWGQELTYPIEIKEKTAANDRRLGDYFGLDLGPFVKLAFYAARRGNLHSIFVVREIDDIESRNLLNWWFIKFDDLAKHASWTGIGGGKSMGGGRSTVVAIPKAEFALMTVAALSEL